MRHWAVFRTGIACVLVLALSRPANSDVVQYNFSGTVTAESIAASAMREYTNFVRTGLDIPFSAKLVIDRSADRVVDESVPGFAVELNYPGLVKGIELSLGGYSFVNGRALIDRRDLSRAIVESNLAVTDMFSPIVPDILELRVKDLWSARGNDEGGPASTLFEFQSTNIDVVVGSTRYTEAFLLPTDLSFGTVGQNLPGGAAIPGVGDEFGLSYWPVIFNFVFLVRSDGGPVVAPFGGLASFWGTSSTIEILPSAVPEPSTMLLSMLGVCGTAIVARRRRRKGDYGREWVVCRKGKSEQCGQETCVVTH